MYVVFLLYANVLPEAGWNVVHYKTVPRVVLRCVLLVQLINRRWVTGTARIGFNHKHIRTHIHMRHGQWSRRVPRHWWRKQINKKKRCGHRCESNRIPVSILCAIIPSLSLCVWGGWGLVTGNILPAGPVTVGAVSSTPIGEGFVSCPVELDSFQLFVDAGVMLRRAHLSELSELLPRDQWQWQWRNEGHGDDRPSKRPDNLNGKFVRT